MKKPATITAGANARRLTRWSAVRQSESWHGHPARLGGLPARQNRWHDWSAGLRPGALMKSAGVTPDRRSALRSVHDWSAGFQTGALSSAPYSQPDWSPALRPLRDVGRSKFGVQRSTSNVQRSTFNVAEPTRLWGSPRAEGWPGILPGGLS